MFVRSSGRARLIGISELVCIRAAGDYTELVTAGARPVLFLRSLKEWEARLPPRHFARIHRSFIVRLDRVLRVEPAAQRSFRVFLQSGGEPVPMSRRAATRLRRDRG